MLGNIDEKVLSMQFDNKQFEKGIEESSKSLDDFKKKLDFSKVTSGLKTFSSGIAGLGKSGFNTLKSGAEKTTSALTKLKSALSLSKATKSLTALGSVSFEGLQSGMDSLGEKLNSLGSLGEMAMYRIKNAILDAAQSAIQFGKSLSVDQINAGLAKYEEKISSIKTISNATQMSAEAVNTQLDRLNWFTDETSANFSDMVNNIGKFTSVGRGLDESITAMQGIATWGYHSGASIAEQSRAMYNLSQALGTGSVKLMDWKSIENAGMATKEFKEQAIAAAEAAGTLKRKGDKLFAKGGKEAVTASNFNATLAKGWFTSDVLMDVLEEYGGFATKVRAYQEAHPGKFSLASEAMTQMDIDRMTDRLKALSPNLDVIAKKNGKDATKLKDQWQEVMDFANGDDVSYEELESKVNDFTRTLGINMEEVSKINKIADTKERTKEIKKWAEELGVDVKTAETLLKKLAETEETLGEKAFKSSQQAKSFTEAIEATKDAVSTQWMNSFQIIFGGLDDSIKLWSDVTEMFWDIFASGGEARNNMLTHWANEFKGREDLFGEDGFIHSIYDSIMSVKEVLGSTFKDVFFPSLNKALGVTQDQAKDIANGLVTLDQLKFIQQGNLAGAELKKITTQIKDVGQTIKDFFTDETNVENMGRVLKGVFSVFQTGGKILSAVTGGIGDFLKESGAAGKVLAVFGDIGDKVYEFLHELQVTGTWNELQAQITETLMGFDGLLDNLDLSFVTSSLQAIFDVFKTGWKFVRAVLNGVSGFLQNSGVINKVLGLFNDFATRISSFMTRIENSGVFEDITNNVTTLLTEASSLLDDLDLEFVDHVLDGIFAAVRGIAGFIKSIISGITRGLKKSGAIKTVSNIVTKISDSVKKFFDTIRNNGDLKRFENGIADLVAQFAGLFDGLDLSGFDSFLTGAWAVIANAWEGIKAVFIGIMEFLDAFGIPQAAVNAIGTIGGWLTWISDKMKEFHVWEDFTAGIKSGIGKVKEVFDHFKEEITRFLEDSGIAAKFREWKAKLKEWLFPSSLDENGELTGLAKIFQDIRNSFNDGIEKLKNAKVYDWLMEKWQQLKDSGIIDGLKSFWSAIKGLFGGGEGAEDAGTEAEQGEEAVKKQGSFFDTLKDVFSKIDFGSLTGAIIGIGALFLAFKVITTITGLIKRVTDVVQGVSDFVEGLSDITGNFAKSLKKSTKWTQIGIMVAAIGGAIWLIADAVIKLGQLSPEQLIQGGAAMVVCAGVLVGVIAVMKKLSKNKAAIGIKDLLGLIVMTIMINKLADVVIKLAKLDTPQMIRGLAGMGTILLMIYGFADNMKAEKQSKTMVDMGFLFTIGDAMLKLADVVAKLGALPVDQLVKGLAGLGTMMLMLALFMKYTTLVFNKDHYSAKNTSGFMKLIGLAAALWLLSKVLLSLSVMSWEQIGKGLVAMAGIMVLIGAFMRATTKQVEFGKGMFSKNTAGFFKMMGIALVMLVMASVLKKLGSMEWEQIGKGLTALAGVMLIIGVFMKATTTTFNKNYYNNKEQAGFFKLIGTALIMIILAKVLKSLAQLSWEQIGKGLTAMAGIMVLIGVFVKSMTKTFGNNNERKLTRNQAGFMKLMGIALAVVLLAHAFKGLAGLSWSGIIKGLIAMTAIMALMMIVVKMASGTGFGAGIKSAVTFGVMIGLGVAVTLFALSLRSLSTLPLEGILKGVIGLTGILLAIALFMKVTSKLTTAGGLMKGLLVLLPIAMAMGLFVLALQVVKDINPTVIAAFGVGLAAVVGAMAYLVGAIALTGALPIGAAIKGSLAISAMMAIILGVATALVAGLGALANAFPGFKAAIETGVEIFGLIGKAFGSLIGGFLGGILGGIASAGPVFAEGIEALGKGVRAFSESITGMGGDTSDRDREAAINSLLALVAIAHLLPRSGGLLQLAIGHTDMGGFAKDISSLGTGIKSFANSIKGMSKLDKNDQKSALASIASLVGIAHALPRKGGLVQKIFGQGDLGEFASNIADLGKGLKSFSNSIRGMSKNAGSEDMTAAMAVADDLAKFAKFVTDPGSFGDVLRLGLGKMLGVNTDFGDFISYIEPFGKALNAYTKAVKGIGSLSGDSTNAIAIAEDILNFKNKVEDPGSVGQILLNWFAGITGTKTTFDDFIAQIEPFGNAMKAYAGAIGGFDKTVSDEDSAAVIAAATSIKKFRDSFGSDNFGEAIVNAIDGMFGNGEAVQFDKFIAQITPFGAAIKAYAETVKGFSTNVSSDDTEAAIAAAQGIKDFAGKFKSGDLGEAILKGIDSLFGSGETVGFERFTAQMKPFGEGLKAYAEGIGNITQISSEDQASALVAANGLKSFADSFGGYNADTGGQGLFAYIVDRLSGAFSGQNTAMSEFATFSAGMVDFGTGLSNYAAGIKDIAVLQPGQADTAMQTVEAVKKFAESLIPDASNKTWFDNLLAFSASIGVGSETTTGSALSQFGTAMQELGKGIAEFASAAGTVKIENSDNAIAAVEAVAELANSELLKETGANQGGILNDISNFFSGSKAQMLNSFAEDMGTFGESITKFATSLQNYPTEDLPIDNAVKAVQDFQSAIKVLTSDDSLKNDRGYNGAVIDFFESITNTDVQQTRFNTMMDVIGKMGTFGTNISSFANAVKDYESPSGIVWDNLKQTLTDMAAFATELSSAGYGTNVMWYSVSALASDLKEAMPDLIEVSKIINGTSSEVESTGKFEVISNDVLTSFGSLMNTFATLASAMAGLKGENGLLRANDFYNLKEFGSGIVEIGTGLSSVMSSIGSWSEADTADGGKIDQLIKMIDAFKTVAVAFADFEYMPSYRLKDFGWDLKEFFNSNISQIQWDKVNVTKMNDVASAVTMLAYAAARIKEAAVTSADISTMGEIITMLLGLNGSGDDKGTGETLAKSFVTNFCATLNAEVTTATSSNGQAFIAGHNMSIGFANGMLNSNAMTSVANAGRSVALKAIEAMKAAANEASPSKETEQIGKYMNEGLAIGLGEEHSDIVKNASSAVGMALAAFSAALDEDPEEQPTITPVVDLSNVEAGAEAAGSMFGGKYTLGVNTSGDLAGRAANKGNEPETNDVNVNVDTTSVAATIETMNNRLDALANQMTNLKVILNSGALVGQIAPQMNRELGKIANRNSIA